MAAWSSWFCRLFLVFLAPYALASLHGRGAEIVSPVAGSQFGSSTVTFEVNAKGLERYSFKLGTAPDTDDIYGDKTYTESSVTVSDLPADESVLYATVWSQDPDPTGQAASPWVRHVYEFRARSRGAELVSPVAHSQLDASTMTFEVNAKGLAYYYFKLGTAPDTDDIYGDKAYTESSVTVSDLPADESVLYATVWSQDPDPTGRAASPWVRHVYEFKSCRRGAELISPLGGSQLGSSTVTFEVNTKGLAAFYLKLGTAPGTDDIHKDTRYSSRSVTVSNLPHDGKTIYASVWSNDGGWIGHNYEFIARDRGVEIIAPADGAKLSSTTATFELDFKGIERGVDFKLGTTSGGHDLYRDQNLTESSVTVTGLPNDGSVIYASVWVYDGGWKWHAYTFIACDRGVKLVSPVNGSQLGSSTVTFELNRKEISGYYFKLGTAPDTDDILKDQYYTGSSVTAVDLPSDESVVYATVWSVDPDSTGQTERTWKRYVYEFTARSRGAEIVEPADYSRLSSSVATFYLNLKGLSHCGFKLGTAPNTSDLYFNDYVTEPAVTVDNLPADGRSIYATVWSHDGEWSYSTRTYSSQPVFKWTGYGNVFKPAATVIAAHQRPPFAKNNTYPWRAGIVNTVQKGWFAVHYGNNLNPLLTDAIIEQALDRLNQAYDWMYANGYPLSYHHKNGVAQDIYIPGSGLEGDDNPNTYSGGYQAWLHVSETGEWVPVALCSYDTFYDIVDNPDPFNSYRYGVLFHENIHCNLSTMRVVNGAPGWWLHEGGNNWASFEYRMHIGKINYVDNYRDALLAIGSHVPVESANGWLADGSFSGVVRTEPDSIYNESQLYATALSRFLSEYVASGANAWIWQNADADSKNVIQLLSTVIGDERARHLVTEFRARQAMCDFGPWSERAFKTMRDYIGQTISSDRFEGYEGTGVDWVATPYVKTSIDKDGRTLIPADVTLPGWTGSNQIPLEIEEGATSVSVDFDPLGQNMHCQLLYRAADGTVVYGPYVSSGICSLNFSKPVANGVVIAVVTSTDYIYEGEENNIKKYDYVVTMGRGIAKPADTLTKWFSLGARINGDADGDGIIDSVEGSLDTDRDGIVNYRDTDSDGDGYSDISEGVWDIDNDGIPNYLDGQ